MQYFWIDFHLLHSDKTENEERSERVRFVDAWCSTMDRDYVVPSVSHQYKDPQGIVVSSFCEVPYPLTNEEADTVLDSLEAHLRKNVKKVPYDLDSFVDAKECKGVLVGGSVSWTLEELREHAGTPQR